MRGIFLSLGVFVGVFALLILSSAHLPLTWDEGEMGVRAEGVAEWTWSGTVTDEGHPQFPVLLTAFGKFVCPPFFSPETRLRFGVILWFAAAVGTVFYRLRQEFDSKTAVFGVVSILLVPRLFAHAQIAAWDSPLTAAWMFVWALFPRQFDSTFRAALWGVFLGLALASKFPGWAAPLPFGIWMLCRFHYGKIKAVDLVKRTVAVGVTALAVFFLLNPPLWPSPVEGFREFFCRNTNRELNVSILFLGKLYDLHHSLPWYNTLFWTVITVPLGLLVFFGVGLKAIIRSEPKRWAGLLLVLNMATPLILRALPGTPVHDGTRLFVAAFPFLAVLAAIGAAALWTTWKKKILVIAVYGACGFNMLWYAPQWLSFYNLAIGGLPGAVRIGMEPTYYWDALDCRTLDWLNDRVEPGEKVVFSYGSALLLENYRRWERITFDYALLFEDLMLQELRDSGVRWYVFQHRSGLMFPRDDELIRDDAPAYVKTIRRGGFGPWNLGAVPLLEIHDLNSETADSPSTISASE